MKLPDVRFLFSPFLPTPPLWPPKLEYNAVSAERSIKFGNIVQGENLTIFDKDRDTAKLRRKVNREQRRSLRLLCTVGGNLAKLNARNESVVQLVAIKRDWMCVPNLKSPSAFNQMRQGGVYSANIIFFLSLNFLLHASRDTSRDHQQRSIEDE